MKSKIKDRPGLVKDFASGAIVSTDTGARDEYLQKKAMFNAKRSVEENLNKENQRLTNLENDMNEIKTLLRTLIDVHTE